MKKTICLDFDGVLHSYTSGWKGATEIPDPPVHGALAWLKELIGDERFEVAIYSSRSNLVGGIAAMKRWLAQNWSTMYGGDIVGVRSDRKVILIEDAVEWPTEKPAAHLTIDDRAWQFRGIFPTMGNMASFTPWNKVGDSAPIETHNDVIVLPDGQVRTYR